MAYSEVLANRVREALAGQPAIEEKKMFQSLAFMVNGKLCICAGKEELLLRTNPAGVPELVEQNGCRQMMQNDRIMKGWVRVDESVLQTKKAFAHWIKRALDYNPLAKSATKKAAPKPR